MICHLQIGTLEDFMDMDVRPGGDGEGSSVAVEVVDEENRKKPGAGRHEQRVTLLGSFSHQVAGHGAILRAAEGRICKPLMARELWFYRTLFDTSSSGRTYPHLVSFVPHWFGCFHISKDQLLALVHHSQPTEEEEEEGSVTHKEPLHVETWSERVYHDLEAHLTAEPRGLVHRTLPIHTNELFLCCLEIFLEPFNCKVVIIKNNNADICWTKLTKAKSIFRKTAQIYLANFSPFLWYVILLCPHSCLHLLNNRILLETIFQEGN